MGHNKKPMFGCGTRYFVDATELLTKKGVDELDLHGHDWSLKEFSEANSLYDFMQQEFKEKK